MDLQPQRVVSCLSGGVDSSVAAALLQDAGHAVTGAFFRSGFSGGGEEARRVSERLGIPFHVLPLEQEFGRVIERFTEEYARGRTPNPCLLCNRWLKLGHVLAFARHVGASRVATGHYARVVRHEGRWTLERPRDGEKDQSYVLAVLEQEQLASLVLPLGELTKSEVRRQAERRGLDRVVHQAESQEICFVTGDYRALLRERLPASSPALQPGEIRDVSGALLGHHTGTAGFTVGQRRGIGIPASHPLYVQRTDPARRLVVVGPAEELGRSRIEAVDAVWLGRRLEPGESVVGRAQIRAHGASHPARVTATGVSGFVAVLEQPARGVAPGQAAVIYDADDRRVLFSGWIHAAS